jgi:hypothetical protein|tara:strand:- start:897 stop:1046 length:150 start_codon:yes stop_codon:yes gene_type:complete
MIDSLKTIGNGAIGVGVWWINLPMMLQMCVSIATLVYIVIRIKKELKNK